MGAWASLQTLYSIVITIILFINLFFLFRKESFILRKQTSLILLVGDAESSRTYLRESDATFQADDAREDAHQCVLHLPGLNRETVERLLVSHPNVTQLTLSASRLTILTANESLRRIGDLLYGWKASLLSLKLILKFTHLPGNDFDLQMAPFAASDLLSVINQKLTCLEHLTLVSNSRLLPHYDFRLCRLRSFTIQSCDPVSWLIGSFSTYATRNGKLECIQMQNSLHVGCTFPEFTPQLWSKFTHLHVEKLELEPRTPVAEWPLLGNVSQLSNLTYLALTIQFTGPSEYSALMTILAVFKQLTTLTLDINSDSMHDLHREATHPPQVLPELSNIRQLSLNLSSFGHIDNQVELFFIDAIFPRLHVLTVHFEAQFCVECYASDDAPVSADVLQDCARELYSQVAQVSVAQKKVTFQWEEEENSWTPAQLAIQE